MLRLMVASHPHIGVPPEGGFVVTMGWHWRQRQLTQSDYPNLVRDFLAEENTQDWQLTRTELCRALEARRPDNFAQFVDTVYRQYLSKKFAGKRRWGDKTTWYIDFIPMLSELFPSAQFVHLFRDGRDVACSYLNTTHLSHSIPRIAYEWRTNLQTAKRAGKRLGRDRLLELSYERLTREPESELRRLCTFLGEDYSESMRDFHANNAANRLEPERHMNWKRKTLLPVDTSSIGRWKQQLTPAQVRKFERVAGDELLAHGYDLEHSKPPEPERILQRLGGGSFGLYWRTRQGLRGTKARWKRRLPLAANEHAG